MVSTDLKAERGKGYEKTGVTIVEFKIKRDGTLGKVAVAETSLDESLDETTLNAVRSASPFKPLPKDFESKSFGFPVHLGYNQPIPGTPCTTTLPGVCPRHDGAPHYHPACDPHARP